MNCIRPNNKRFKEKDNLNFQKDLVPNLKNKALSSDKNSNENNFIKRKSKNRNIVKRQGVPKLSLITKSFIYSGGFHKRLSYNISKPSIKNNENEFISKTTLKKNKYNIIVPNYGIFVTNTKEINSGIIYIL